MAFQMDRRPLTSAQAEAAQIDVGLRQYMLRVYNYMASGVALTGIIAYLVANTALGAVFFQAGADGRLGPTMLGWVAMFAPLGFVLVLNFGVARMKASTLQTVFWLFAGTMGISMASIFLTFTGVSIARVFFITAASFAGLSLYGYTTRRDLSAMGAFMVMGLIGIVIAMLVNIFLQSSALHFAISVIGVIVFAGLTAWDTQQIKSMYWEADGDEITAKKAILGATSLYLDFVNLFTFMMQFFGERR